MSHLSTLIASLGRDDPDFSVGRRPGGGRSSAVLALVSETDNDIILTRRPLSLRHHAGQVALPGDARRRLMTPSSTQPCGRLVRRSGWTEVSSPSGECSRRPT
mgnify:CR=1 FL=1